jgi:hypothetical protein
MALFAECPGLHVITAVYHPLNMSYSVLKPKATNFIVLTVTTLEGLHVFSPNYTTGPWLLATV